MVNENKGDNPIKIDPLNPPEKTLVTYAGNHKEVLCRRHFFARVKKDGNRFYGGYTYIKGLKQAPAKEPCFDCTHNP